MLLGLLVDKPRREAFPSVAASPSGEQHNQEVRLDKSLVSQGREKLQQNSEKAE